MDIYRLGKGQILATMRGEGVTVRRFNLADVPGYPDDIPAALAYLEAQTLAEPEDLSIIFDQTPVLTVREASSLEGDDLGAPHTAREFFAASPAAVAFIRLTPDEQAAQIDGMTTAQLKTVVKYLAVAVSALVKREFL